jgi:hypothetical protein
MKRQAQRFSKTKRGAAYRTKTTHCTTFAFAPNRMTIIDQ